MTEGRGRAVRLQSDDEELQLLVAARAGDLRAFESLYRLYAPRLTRFATLIVRRESVVEEVVDDTMMVVWRRSEDFRGGSRLSTWIFAIAYRTALKARRRQDEPIDDPGAPFRPSLDPDPEQIHFRQQTQKVLAEAMLELSPDHRTVVDLTYFHNMSCREIAEIMDCPIDTVKTRMFHARRRLRACLPGELVNWL